MSKLVVIIRSDGDKNDCVNLVLESLMIQTYRPDKIVLWNYNFSDCSIFNIMCHCYDINFDEIISEKLEITDKSINDFDFFIGISSRDILNVNFLKCHKDILEKNKCITTSIISQFIDQGLCHFYPDYNRIQDITWNRENPFIYSYDYTALDNFGVSKSTIKSNICIDNDFFLESKKKSIPCLTHKYLHKINIPKNII